MLVPTLRPLMLLIPFAWLAYEYSPSITTFGSGNTSTLAPLGLSMAAEAGSANTTPEDWYRSAQQAADRAYRAENVPEARAAELAQAAALAALARSAQSAELPWDNWIDAELRNRDALALGLFMAAEHAQAPGSLERAMRLSGRATPVLLRIRAHRSLWRHEPYRALHEGKKLSLEPPRGTTSLHARYVEMLARVNHELSEELLTSFAVRDSSESMARALAIRALVDTGKIEYAYVLAPIWKSTSSDRATRQLALVSALQLDPSLEQLLLFDDVPSRQQYPLLREFVNEVRLDRGLPPLTDTE